jgi:ubiquinone/menaquinone biosynthesis C-methylase UbiE
MAVADKAALIAGFGSRYRQAGAEVIQEIERATLGCAYGGTSWTTRVEAEAMASLLGLGPGVRALEVGSGAGWPGLYLAEKSGCDMALVDLPFDGLRAVAARAAADGMADRCWPAVADGAALPFGTAFDAIVHSDVLCCLEAKREMLRECRRVIRESGRMVFSVISVAPGLEIGQCRRAASFGPMFVEADADYSTLLRETGWAVTGHDDITAGFATSVRTLLEQEKRHAEALIDLVGEDGFAERLATLRKRLEGAESGLIMRELFATAPTG